MKFYFKSVFFAVVLMAGLASCSNEEGVDNPATGVDEGNPTAFALTIGQPKTYATDANATTDELEVKTIDVFIFNKNSVFQKHESLKISDFEIADNVYKYKNAIKSTTGDKRIYVGINLPSEVVTAIPTQGVNAVSGINEVSDLKSNGFAMFNIYKGETTLLVESDEDGSANQVKITVARILSKVMVAKKSGFTPGAVAGGTISDDLEFSVGNINKKYFVYPTADNKDPNYEAVTDWEANFYHLFDTGDANAYQSVNANFTDMKTAKAHYIMENTSSGKKKNEHTYADIRVTFTPSEMVTYIKGTDTEPIKAGAGSTGDTFYTVQKNNRLYYFEVKTQADDWAGTENKVVEYKDGKCYYRVFLTGEDKEYDVLRNTIYKVTIASVAGIGKGEAGLDKDDGGGDGGEEEEDIDTPTAMKVEVTIENWNIETQEADL